MNRASRLPMERQIDLQVLSEIEDLRRGSHPFTFTIKPGSAEFAKVRWLMMVLGHETAKDLYEHLTSWAFSIVANNQKSRGLSDGQ